MKQKIKAIVDSFVDQETYDAPADSPWARGGVQQPLRMMTIAHLAAMTNGGYFCEIGASVGGTTQGLARIAQVFNRRVVVVDPWITGTANCSGIEYDLFLKNTREWKDIIDIVRLPSENPDAIKYVKERSLCFAYVDGSHTYENCSIDIQTVSHAGIVCVDDLWCEELLRAFNESPREKYYNPICHEGYIFG